MKKFIAGNRLYASDLNGTFAEILSYFGDGSDGDVVISVDTDLSADMYYNNLTINSGITLNPNGYRIFVKEKLTNNGTIARNGNDGGDGTNATSAPSPTFANAGVGGIGGAELAPGTIYGSLAGVIGANGVKQISNGHVNGNNGAIGLLFSRYGINLAITGSAPDGGKGGNTASSTGGIGGAGTVNQLDNIIFSLRQNDILEGDNDISDYIGCELISSYLSGIKLTPQSGGGSGGSGSCSSTGTGGASGGGGGSASGGGIVYIQANEIENNGVIEANGGNGGNGGSPYALGTNRQGGSGGGAGGNGGIVILLYKTLTTEGSVNVNGGYGGTASSGVNGGAAGEDGGDGSDGKIFKIEVNGYN